MARPTLRALTITARGACALPAWGTAVAILTLIGGGTNTCILSNFAGAIVDARLIWQAGGIITRVDVLAVIPCSVAVANVEALLIVTARVRVAGVCRFIAGIVICAARAIPVIAVQAAADIGVSIIAIEAFTLTVVTVCI